MIRFLLLLLPFSLSALPIRFEFNQGQFSPSVVFAARGVFLTSSGPVFPHGIRMTFTGARMGRPVAGTPAGSIRYFNRNSPVTAPEFSEVRYREIYPGIDLVFRDGAGKVEYDFVLAPGAAPRAIRMHFPGARRVAIESGELVVDDLRHRKPAVYQESGGARRYIDASYRLRAGEVTFELGDYDRTLPLVIDPVLTYATYDGGAGTETGNAIAVDSAGNAYLAGGTDSPSTHAFLTKLDPAGAKILATAAIGGASIDGIAIDAANNIIVTGSIITGADFPGATKGAYQAGATAYAARFTQDSAGFKPAFIATFAAVPSAVALDPSGAIYLTGSADAAFQTTAGALRTTPAGSGDAFALKLSPDGSQAVYATFLGGSNTDTGRAIAVDAAGQAVLAGDTVSADFPLTPGAAQTKFGGRIGDYGDAFVARLNAAGAQLVYATYLGGAAPDIAYGIALDKDGNAYVTGGTQSADFPVTAGAYQAKYAGGTPVSTPDPAGDAFVTKLSISGALVWSTFLGGSGRDLAEAIAVDTAANVYVTGASDSANFPLTAGALRGCRTGGPWLSQLDAATGGKLLNSTSIGGMSFDEPHAIAVAGANAVYIAGDTTSRVFFASGGAAQPIYGGGDSDAFAARFDLTASTQLMVACVLNGASFQPGNFAPYPLGTVAPGEFVSIFGIGVGPDQPAIAQPAAGSYPTTLGGSQVFFDGVPAVMLYADATQINAIVPYGIKGPVTQMTVRRGGLTDGPRAIPVAPAVPGIFTANSAGTQQAAVLNEDGTYNSPANPAVVGHIIVFYAVGAGLMNPPVTDGAVSPNVLPLPAPQLPVSVQIRGADAKVLYAGAAPGYVSGLLQINVEVPLVVGFGNSVPLTLQVGGQPSQFNVTIATTTPQ
jgi:uncharacterized protein (TIGR03437 family)